MSKQSEPAIAWMDDGARTDLDTPSLTRELTRVEEANEAFYEAFALRDVEAMARVWSKSPHARCIHPGWELVVGWPEIRQSWVEIMRTIASIEFHLDDAHIEVAGRTAWVNQVVYVHITTDDDESFAASMVTTNLYERIDGDWLLLLHHSSNFQEEETTIVEEDLDMEPSGQSGSGFPGLN